MSVQISKWKTVSWALNTWGKKTLRFLSEIALFLGNSTT